MASNDRGNNWKKVEKPKKKKKIISPEIKKNRLHNSYCFWYYQPNSEEKYENCVKRIGEAFNTVEDFWLQYTHIVRPRDVKETNIEYQLFKEGIKPLWEDEPNKMGGKWMLRCKKEFSTVLWEKLVLCMIGEQFNVGREINGVVIGIREYFDIISVWNRNYNNKYAKEKIRDTLKSLFELPEGTIIEYRPFYVPPNKKFDKKFDETFRINRGRGRNYHHPRHRKREDYGDEKLKSKDREIMELQKQIQKLKGQMEKQKKDPDAVEKVDEKIDEKKDEKKEEKKVEEKVEGLEKKEEKKNEKENVIEEKKEKTGEKEEIVSDK